MLLSFLLGAAIAQVVNYWYFDLMFGMQKKKRIALKVVFVGMEISILTIKLKYTGFFYNFLTYFTSIYIIFMKAKCFMWTNVFRRKKNVEMLGLHPQRNMSIMHHLHSYIIINDPSFGGIRWWQNCRLCFLRCLPFRAPCLFWLSRFNFSFQHVNAGNGIKSHNTL